MSQQNAYEQDEQDEQDEEFEQASLDFVTWFLQQPNTRSCDQVIIKDLRDQEAGRGVGSVPSP